MKAPKRWLQEGGSLSHDERRALVAARELAPPPGAEKRAWALIAAHLPPGQAEPDGGGSGFEPSPDGAPTLGQGSAAGKLAFGSAIKAAAIGVGVGAAVFGGAALWTAAFNQDKAPAQQIESSQHQQQTEPLAPAILPPNAQAEAADQNRQPHRAERSEPTREHAGPEGPAAAPASKSLDLERPARPWVPTPMASRETAPSSDASHLDGETAARTASQESRLVARARAALRAGDASSALRILDDVRARYPNPILDQEIEALSIEALLAVGRRDSAEQRAQRFLQRYPDSPYAQSVRRAVGP